MADTFEKAFERYYRMVFPGAMHNDDKQAIRDTFYAGAYEFMRLAPNVEDVDPLLNEVGNYMERRLAEETAKNN